MSGNFRSVAIASITINKGARQRRELEDLDTLAASIQAIGLLNPIIIT